MYCTGKVATQHNVLADKAFLDQVGVLPLIEQCLQSTENTALVSLCQSTNGANQIWSTFISNVSDDFLDNAFAHIQHSNNEANYYDHPEDKRPALEIMLHTELAQCGLL